jgi:hypothetical protein
MSSLLPDKRNAQAEIFGGIRGSEDSAPRAPSSLKTTINALNDALHLFAPGDAKKMSESPPIPLMPKLHELLAIESNLETQASKVRADLANTFEKKRHLFEEKRLLFTPNTEGAQVVTEQQTDIQTTAQKELAWVQPHLAKALNASYQVAEANTQARADIILEDSDTPLVKDVPATSLLELQKRLAEILHLAQAIPTLDPAKGFTADPQRGPGIYKAREIRKTRTTEQPKVIVK